MSKRDKIVSTTTCNGVNVTRTEAETYVILLGFIGTIIYTILMFMGVFK